MVLCNWVKEMSDSNVTDGSDEAGEAGSVILRGYYKESDFFASPEGILKALSVVSTRFFY